MTPRRRNPRTSVASGQRLLGRPRVRPSKPTLQRLRQWHQTRRTWLHHLTSFRSTWTPGGWRGRPRSPIKSAQIELPIVGAGLGHVQTSSPFSAKVNNRIRAERGVLCHQRWERSTHHHRQAKPPFPGFLAQLSGVIRFQWWFILKSYENDTVL